MIGYWNHGILQTYTNKHTKIKQCDKDQIGGKCIFVSVKHRLSLCKYNWPYISYRHGIFNTHNIPGVLHTPLITHANLCSIVTPELTDIYQISDSCIWLFFAVNYLSRLSRQVWMTTTQSPQSHNTQNWRLVTCKDHSVYLKCRPSDRTVSICIPPTLLKMMARWPPSTVRTQNNNTVLSMVLNSSSTKNTKIKC